MRTNLSVKTAQAAEIAGVGYEGFRSWLKRGLLQETGTLPKFYAAHVPAEVADAKRWRWSAFGFADLCSFRLTKLMLAAGLPRSTTSAVASDETLWRSHDLEAGEVRYVAVFPKLNQHTLYSPETLAADLADGTIKHDWMTLFDLHQLRDSVVFRSRAVALRTIAADVGGTSHIFVRSGPNVLAPEKAAERQRTIEALATRLGELADAVAEGAGSYRQFEEVLAGLHALGKFPDNAAVSAVAFAFAIKTAPPRPSAAPAC